MLLFLLILLHNPGIKALVGINTSSAFQFRLMTHVNYKRLKYNTLLNGNVDGYLAYDFIGGNLGLLARYSLNLKKWKIAPGAGFFFSYNDSQGQVFKTNSPTSVIGIEPSLLDDYDMPMPLSVGTLGTLEIVPPFSINGRTMSFQVSCWYALSDFFDEPLELPSNIETRTIDGIYHQLSLSLNFYFNRIKSNQI